MKMNKFAAEVHQNAVEHGWWDEERSFGEIIALCHSELSEALEEYRAKRGMVWYACTEGDQEHPCRPEDEYDCQKFGKEVECEYRSKKPEASPWSWPTVSSVFWTGTEMRAWTRTI